MAYFRQPMGVERPGLGVQAMRGLFGIFKDERGATLIEYGLIIALICLAMMVGLQSFAGTTIEMWNRVSEEVTSV